MNKMFKVKTQHGTAYVTCNVETANEYKKFIEDIAREKNIATEVKVFSVGEMPLDELPEDIQQKAKGVLKAYASVRVVYEYGRWSVGAGCCIKSEYEYDHFVAGEYFANVVYMPEERRQNFIEEFGYAPRI